MLVVVCFFKRAVVVCCFLGPNHDELNKNGKSYILAVCYVIIAASDEVFYGT
jgi:hypothetical protein